MLDYEVTFPDYFSGPGEMEYEAKGYLADVLVAFSSGRRFKLFFFDAVRAQQQVNASGMLIEPNLIIVSNVDRKTILAAIREAVEQQYFDEIGELQSS